VHWQSLYHPACLDPLQLGADIRQLALTELRQVLSQADLDHAQRNFLQETEARHLQATNTVLTTELIKHIDEIESKYHPDSLGQFKQLWPEIARLL
jgi:t-SNARE complex subunit (syntaxin)